MFLYLNRGGRNETNHSINQTKDRMCRCTFLRRNTSQKAIAALARARDRLAPSLLNLRGHPEGGQLRSRSASLSNQARQDWKKAAVLTIVPHHSVTPQSPTQEVQTSPTSYSLSLSLCFYFSSFHPRSISLTAPAPGPQPSKCSPPG